MLRLAAVAPGEGDRSTVRLLRQLFQVALAGTQADDRRRRAALEEALEEDDPRIRRVSVKALGAMIQTQVSRSDEFEQIGAEAYRPGWSPDDRGTIDAYFDWSPQRLLDLWRKDVDLRPTIEEHVAGDIRNLLSPAILPTLETFVREVVAANEHWLGATHGIGDWLYFDRTEEPTGFSVAVRALFDVTLPTDPVDLVRLHSRFWVSDLHDPDRQYSNDQENPDFEYSARRVQALAPEIASDAERLERAVRVMASEEMNAPQVFAHALAPELPDPLATFGQAVAALDASGTGAGTTFVASLLSAVDRQLQDQPDDVRKLESLAKASAALADNPMRIVTSLRVTDERLDAFTSDVREGRVTPAQSVFISYGRGLETVGHAALARFIATLVDRGRDGGSWAALDILSMVTHGATEVAPGIVNLAKLAILSPYIADEPAGGAANADFIYDRMLRLIDAAGGIDADFAGRVAQQIVQACRTTGPQRDGHPDALRGALAIVIRRAPNEVWPVLAGLYEIATRVDRERLNAFTSATRRFAYDVSRTGAGVLFHTPLDLMLDWVAADPDGRVAFLLSFFPILEPNGGEQVWHPALQKLARLYGGRKRFRDALRLRIYSNSWGGSLKPHLTSFRAPLATWAVDAVHGDWADTMLDSVNRSLESEFY